MRTRAPGHTHNRERERERKREREREERRGEVRMGRGNEKNRKVHTEEWVAWDWKDEMK